MKEKPKVCGVCLGSGRLPKWKPISKKSSVLKCVGFVPCSHCKDKTKRVVAC